MCAAKSSPYRRAADLAARDRIVMQEIEKEQEARDEKTARLRALRLAKEAADKEHLDKAEVGRLADVKQAVKPPGKKSARAQQRSAASKIGSAERPTRHGQTVASS